MSRKMSHQKYNLFQPNIDKKVFSIGRGGSGKEFGFVTLIHGERFIGPMKGNLILPWK